MYVVDLPVLLNHLKPVLGYGFLGFILSMALTPIYTTLAYKYQFWKKPRATSTTGEIAKVFNKLHAEKHERHIPTMAGIVMVVSIMIVTVLFNWHRTQTYIPLFAMVLGGLIGLIDDVINVRGIGAGVAGLSTKLKFMLILGLSTVIAWWFYARLDFHSVFITHFGDWNIGWLVIPVFALVMIATANAVNISDGLDGLAGGLLATAFGVYTFIAFLQGRFAVAAFCMTIVGVLLSYLWFNIYPARFFMGDVGSFSLGMTLAVVAILTETVAILPIIGGIFVVEAGSSAIQILSKKLFKKRIFVSAPIHHHFEARGWHETKITMRFWVLGQVLAVVGLLLAVWGGHIAL